MGATDCIRNCIRIDMTCANMEAMDIRHLDDLTVFLRVVDRGGFSVAARELHLSPGAVSKQIARLEHTLGVRLFERNTRNVRLTDEANGVALLVRDIVAQLDRVGDVAARSRGVLEGTIRLTAPAPFGRKYLAPAIAEFRSLHDGVDFELQLSDRVVDLLNSDFDVAIRIGKLADSSLIARRLVANRRVLVASPSYLRSHGTPTQPSELTAHACLVLAYPGSLQNEWMLRNGKRNVNVAVAGPLRSDNGEVLRDWCLAGLGISLRETWDIVDELANKRLVRVLPSWQADATSIFAVHAPSRLPPRRMTAFLDFIAERWRDARWADDE